MLRKTLASLLALFVSSCGAAETRLSGPCSASKRAEPDQAYYDLALSMVFERANGRLPIQLTQERVDRELSYLKSLRADWLPTIADDCLRAHADSWIAFYERNAVDRLKWQQENAGFKDEYEKERAEREDQKRALAAQLGVRP